MITTAVPEVSVSGRYPIGVAAKILGIDRSRLLKLAAKKLIKISREDDDEEAYELAIRLIGRREAILDVIASEQALLQDDAEYMRRYLQ